MRSLRVGTRVGLLLVLGLCCQVSTAQAFTAGEIDKITEHIYRGGAAPISAMQCGTACVALWGREQGRRSSTGSTYALHRELLEIRQRVAVLPGKTYFTPTLDVGKTAASWKIGEVQPKWLRLSVPPPSSGAAGTPIMGRMEWPRGVISSGSSALSGDWEVLAPFIGWTGYKTNGPLFADISLYSPGYGIRPCIPSSSPSLVYSGWQILYGPRRQTQANCGIAIDQHQWPYSRISVVDNGGPGSIEDFDSQATTEPDIAYWPNTPASAEILRGRVVGEIGDHASRYPTLIEWYRALLDDLGSEPDLDEAPFLADKFRPTLRFDTDESWRPLDIERFLSETFSDEQPGEHHEICTSVDSSRQCEPFDISDSTWQTLRDYRQGVGQTDEDDWPVISIHGEGVEVEDFASPRREGCYHDGLNDCDTGTNTALYYRASGPYTEANFRFLDYWMFFRFNKFFPSDHEADWEHIVVALPGGASDPDTFAWVGMSAHSDSSFRYLRDVLRCDGNLSAGSCGSELGGGSGERVEAFIANGSHAIYPEPCSALLGIAECDRTTEGGQTIGGEKGYDGKRPWAANDDPDALRAFPATPAPWDNTTADLHWVNWPGQWGLRNDESHVESPGAPTRDVFYEPWDWTCSERGSDEMINCDSGGELLRAPAGSADATNACDQWAGPGIALSWCDEKELRRGMRQGTLGTATTTPDVEVGGEPRAAATSVGITQVAGDFVRPGETVEIDPEASIPGDLTVGAQLGATRVKATFPARRLSSDGRIGRKLELRLRRTPSGVALERQNETLIEPTTVTRAVPSKPGGGGR